MAGRELKEPNTRFPTEYPPWNNGPGHGWADLILGIQFYKV